MKCSWAKARRAPLLFLCAAVLHGRTKRKQERSSFPKYVVLPYSSVVLFTFFFQYQPPRILVTHHRDRTVQFQDYSAQLLASNRPNPLQHHFPNPLAHLTIDLNSILIPSICKTTAPNVGVKSVYFASESLECAIVLENGDVAVYRFKPEPDNPKPYKEASDAELLILEHVISPIDLKFSPYFLLTSGKGPVSACAISDIGGLQFCSSRRQI